MTLGIVTMVFELMALTVILMKLEGAIPFGWGVCLIPTVITIILYIVFYLKFAYVCGKNEEYSKRK